MTTSSGSGGARTASSARIAFSTTPPISAPGPTARATGRNWVNRGMAHCLVQDNKVVEEWVIRDEFAVLQDLGIDPFAIAAELLKKSPVLGTAMNAAGSPVFAGRIADPIREGISGPRPDRYRRECEMILEMFETVWNGRFFDKLDTYFADTCVCQTVRLRRVMGIAPFQLEIMSLLAAVPDGQIEVRDISVHEFARPWPQDRRHLAPAGHATAARRSMAPPTRRRSTSSARRISSSGRGRSCANGASSTRSR